MYHHVQWWISPKSVILMSGYKICKYLFAFHLSDFGCNRLMPWLAGLMHWQINFVCRVNVVCWRKLTHRRRVMYRCFSKLGHHWFRYWLVSCPSSSHYLNHCRPIVNGTLRNKIQRNFSQNKDIFIHENTNVFENVVCKMADSVCWLVGFRESDCQLKYIIFKYIFMTDVLVVSETLYVEMLIHAMYCLWWLCVQHTCILYYVGL